VGRLERRLRKLEDRAEARGTSPAKLEQARLQRELQEALSRLLDDELYALDAVLGVSIERMRKSGTLVDPYEVSDEPSRQSLDLFAELLAELSGGGQPPSEDPLGSD
jgi:hypothetical protein